MYWALISRKSGKDAWIGLAGPNGGRTSVTWYVFYTKLYPNENGLSYSYGSTNTTIMFTHVLMSSHIFYPTHLSGLQYLTQPDM